MGETDFSSSENTELKSDIQTKVTVLYLDSVNSVDFLPENDTFQQLSSLNFNRIIQRIARRSTSEEISFSLESLTQRYEEMFNLITDDYFTVSN